MLTSIQTLIGTAIVALGLSATAAWIGILAWMLWRGCFGVDTLARYLTPTSIFLDYESGSCLWRSVPRTRSILSGENDAA